jgi:hypothetical protein
MYPKRLRSAVDLHRCTDVGNFLQGAKKCQKVQSENWASTARRAICKSHINQWIGDEACVSQRVKKPRATTRPKTGTLERRCCSLCPGTGRRAGSRMEGGGRESGVRVRVRRGRNSARPPFALALHFRLSVAPPSQQGGGKTPIRSPPIYTGARMLKTRSQTCHFLPFFEFAAGRATRWRRSACQNGIKGSDLGCLCSGDRKKSGKYERRNGSASRRGCSLFLEGGQGGGRRTEDGEWMWLGRGSNG